MNITLLKKYRKLADNKFYILEEKTEYPRCNYRFLHNKNELTPTYVIYEDSSPMWNERKHCIISFKDLDEAKKYLYEQRIRYIHYLRTNEQIRRYRLKSNKKLNF